MFLLIFLIRCAKNIIWNNFKNITGKFQDRTNITGPFLKTLEGDQFQRTGNFEEKKRSEQRRLILKIEKEVGGGGYFRTTRVVKEIIGLLGHHFRREKKKPLGGYC